MKITDGKDHIPQARELIIEYTSRLGRDLSFQDLEAELADIAEKYTAPNGELLLAAEGEKALGMVAYHKHNDIRCEMKRLYVRPEARGMHLGDSLVREIISRAAEAGFKEMVLDTIKPLRSAIGLYKKYGFKECAPYYDNPMDDVIYMIKYL